MCIRDSKRASLLARLRETGATFLFGVPTHAIDLLSELRAGDDAGLPLLKGFRVSGAAVPDAVCTELLDHGITPQSGYGMTEACSHHYTLPDDPPDRITGTSGTACDGYEIRIWSQEDQNKETKVGEIGQIGGQGGAAGQQGGQGAAAGQIGGQGAAAGQNGGLDPNDISDDSD